MKQFRSVFRFELNGYFKSKPYIVVTVLLVAVLMVVLSFPNIEKLFAREETTAEPSAITQIDQLSAQSADGEALAVVNASGALSEHGLLLFANAMSGTKLSLAAADADTVKEQVENGDYSGAIIIQSPQEVTYIARNLELYDDTASRIYSAMTDAARYEKLSSLDITEAEAAAVLNPAVSISVENLGISQTETFFYTYVMLMALYMAIIFYGQIVATSIATEKGSRTMELLITSTRPNSLLFGKMLAAGCAGLIQFAAIFGSAVLFYHLNASAWAGNDIIASIFNMPLPIVGYVLLFFLLGFFLYAFMFGAIGSLVSRVEDVSSSMMPVMLIFVFAFIVVINAVASGNANSPLMVACSYIPFTSPMAMFARITMSGAPWYEVAISITILLATTVGIGMLSASIYRMGVLMYGKPPKLSELWKVVRAARKQGAMLKSNR